MRYIVEFDGRAIKEYAQRQRAINYARQKAKNIIYDDFTPYIAVHAFDGSRSETVWENQKESERLI